MTKTASRSRFELIAGLTVLAAVSSLAQPEPMQAQPVPVAEIRMRLQMAQVGADDEITLRSDDAATYVTRRGYPKRRVTRRTAPLSPGTFARLVALVEQGGIEQLRDQFASTRTHQTLYTVVIKRGEQQKTVTDYGQVGPPALWAFETVVEHLIESAQWS